MKNKKIVIMISSVILLSVVLFIGSLISKQDTELDEVKLNDLNKDSFAIMVEQLDGTYAESDTYPTGNYMLDENLSGCIDKNGKEIANSVSYNNGTVSFKTNSSSYCYVYFSKLTLVKYLLNEETRSSSLWTSTLDGDGYRFVGTDPNNYICFGAEDKDTCIGDTDLYMYRIIGIFEDSSGKQYVKLIKSSNLGTTYMWHNTQTSNASWGDSDLYNGLNENYFLTSNSYSYMQNIIWSDKITNWTWSALETQSSSSGNVDTSKDLQYMTVSNIYYQEMNSSKKPNSGGVWTKPKAKIGIMYASDYLLSLGSSGLDYTANTGSKFDSAWLDNSTSQWTMSRSGAYGSYYRAYYIYGSDAILVSQYTYYSMYVRPVFYLNSNEEYLSGTGTSSDPFMLSGRPKYTVTINSNNDSYGGVSLTSSIVYEGDSVTATFAPNANYKYSTTDCDGTVSGNTLTISNITGNIDCTVTFVEKTKYTVSVSSNNTSYGTVSPATQTVYEGDSATITLNPGTIYKYSGNNCGGTVSGDTLTISDVNSNVNCTVTFVFGTMINYLLSEEMRPASLWTSTLDGDGYRFVGTDPTNYVCFGTTDTDTCVGNTDLYMYRIIGIFQDSEGNNHLKLIKKEALNTAYSLVEGYGTFWITKDWVDTDLYTGLNGSYFLRNTIYSYMQNTIWKSIITSWMWSAVVTPYLKTTVYAANSASNVYYSEMNHANNTIEGTWTTPTGMIGLMYVSDYMMSLGESSLNYTSDANSSSLKTGWMHLANNDTGAPESNELSMSNLNNVANARYSWRISSDGTIVAEANYNGRSVRPVFYLESTVEYVSGTGTSTDPYIIS